MRKLQIIFVIAAIAIDFSAQAAVPLPSEVLDQNDIEKPAFCETRQLVTRNLYTDDSSSFLIVPNLVDYRASESGVLSLSSMDYYYTVSQNLADYRPYVSSACINFAQKIAQNSCAIERIWKPELNQYVISKPQSAEVTARVFVFNFLSGIILVNHAFFEEPNIPLYKTLNYQVSCDGNGLVSGTQVDKL